MRVVTIDGPAGAGKSTVARRVAERLGWRFLDTGAMYRAVVLAAMQQQCPLEDEAALESLASGLHVTLPPGQVLLDGQEIREAIRRPEVTAATRFAANNPGVRTILVGWQRAFARQYDTVTEGRDQGTIVFPEALRKFFLTATPEERARRRHAELLGRGASLPYEQVLHDQMRRDAEDETRAIAPLRAADDAILVDTTGLELEAVVDRLMSTIQEALEGRN